MGPGPSDIHPRVLEAIGKNTVGHLDPYYLEVMDGLQEMLRGLMKTENTMTMAITMVTVLARKLRYSNRKSMKNYISGEYERLPVLSQKRPPATPWI